MARERAEVALTQIENEQLESLANELETPKTQIMTEALALYMKAVAETKVGRRVTFVDPTTKETVYAYTSPILSQVEWLTHRFSASPAQFAAMAEMVTNPPQPNEALRRAVSRRKK